MICSEVCLPKFRFHGLRHTHITNAVEAGTGIEPVMAQVGHISPGMTRHYTHLSREATQRAAEAVADPLLSSIVKNLTG